MKLSENGRKRIQGYEGYHDALPDGSCKAYQRTYHGKLDVPTIGWGCTEGVKMGMVWTRHQAEEAFDREVAKFEDAVTQLVTVPINANEFDALVSLAYNIGIGSSKKPGFSTSSVLKRLNKGDRVGAAKAFHMWNRAGGAVVNGLVQRRASEASLFQKPIEAPEAPSMPQSVTASKEPPSRKTVATIVAAVATAGNGAMQLMPADPLGTAEGLLSTGNRVRGVAQRGHELSGWAMGLPGWPYLIGAGLIGGGLYWVLCHYLPNKQETA